MWPSHRKSDDSRVPRSHFDRRANNAVFRAIILAAAIVGLSTDFAYADETGVSLWVPGFFGSLAAAPQTPGFALANIFYAPSVGAGGSVCLCATGDARRPHRQLQRQSERKARWPRRPLSRNTELYFLDTGLRRPGDDRNGCPLWRQLRGRQCDIEWHSGSEGLYPLAGRKR